jgi:hypothetical protein
VWKDLQSGDTCTHLQHLFWGKGQRGCMQGDELFKLNGFKDFGVFYFCSFLVLMEKESLSLSLQSKGKSSNKSTKDRKNKKKVFPKNKQTAFLLYHFFFFEKREKRF